MGLFYTNDRNTKAKTQKCQGKTCKQATGVSLSVRQDLFYIKQLTELQTSPVMSHI